MKQCEVPAASSTVQIGLDWSTLDGILDTMQTY